MSSTSRSTSRRCACSGAPPPRRRTCAGRASRKTSPPSSIRLRGCSKKRIPTGIVRTTPLASPVRRIRCGSSRRSAVCSTATSSAAARSSPFRARSRFNAPTRRTGRRRGKSSRFTTVISSRLRRTPRPRCCFPTAPFIGSAPIHCSKCIARRAPATIRPAARSRSRSGRSTSIPRTTLPSSSPTLRGPRWIAIAASGSRWPTTLPRRSPPSPAGPR